MNSSNVLEKLREILKLIDEITNKVAELADKLYEEEVNRWENERG